MRPKLTIALLVLTLLPSAGRASTAASAGCRLADAHVETAIAALASAAGGDEYCQYRRYEALSDLDGDGRPDFLVLFTVEPRAGNEHRGFLAAFLSSDAPQAAPIVVETGRRGERDAVALRVEGRRVVLDTLEYLPTDAMCCPSGKGTLTFELSGHGLHRVDAAAPKPAGSRPAPRP